MDDLGQVAPDLDERFRRHSQFPRNGSLAKRCEVKNEGEGAFDFSPPIFPPAQPVQHPKPFSVEAGAVNRLAVFRR